MIPAINVFKRRRLRSINRMNYNPSIYAHTISGGLLLAGTIYLALYISKIMPRDPYQILVLILLFSMTMGIHGLSHAGLEAMYSYSPYSLFTGKQIESYQPIDCPYRRRCNCPYRRRCNCPYEKTRDT